MKPTRSTSQKKAMEAELKGMEHFFSAEEFHERLVKKGGRIGIATVYRFLKDHKKNNRLYSYTCERRIVYSRKKMSHCHFFCEKTGKIIHFDVESLDFLKGNIPGTIKSFQIEVRGTCKECERR